MIRLIIKIVLLIAVVTGLMFLVQKVSDTFNGLHRIYPDFVLGELDRNGEYVESDKKLFTKDIIAYDAIEITKDFDSNVTYQLFFYDHEGNYLSSSGILNTTYTDEEPGITKFIRIVLIPKLEDTEDTIKFFEQQKYTFDLKIKVKANEKATLEFALFVNNVPYTYKYEEGMTWEEFINSDYNVDHLFSINDNGFVQVEQNGKYYLITLNSVTNVLSYTDISDKVYVSIN